MWDYEKLSVVTYPFYSINWQSIQKTNCMQTIKKILIWEVLPAIALNNLQIWQNLSHILYMVKYVPKLKAPYTNDSSLHPSVCSSAFSNIFFETTMSIEFYMETP